MACGYHRTYRVAVSADGSPVWESLILHIYTSVLSQCYPCMSHQPCRQKCKIHVTGLAHLLAWLIGQAFKTPTYRLRLMPPGNSTTAHFLHHHHCLHHCSCLHHHFCLCHHHWFVQVQWKGPTAPEFQTRRTFAA